MHEIFAFITAHSTTIVGVSGFTLAQLGNTMPDLGTPEFFKVWAHDFFKAITASTKKK
jgi:hypothetical protein